MTSSTVFGSSGNIGYYQFTNATKTPTKAIPRKDFAEWIRLAATDEDLNYCIQEILLEAERRKDRRAALAIFNEHRR